MIVVANTSPLHYLILLDHADILQKMYGGAVIPSAVVRELQAANAPQKVKKWIATPPHWLEVRQISVPEDLALKGLDPGESEAIALAESLHADALILDDRAARREAERRNLRVIGTIRVLNDGALAGLLNFPQALLQLQDAGFYLDPKLADFLLHRHSQRNPPKPLGGQ